MTAITASKFTQFCLQYSSIAVIYYDYFLTFGLEVRYMWKSKVNLSTLMYICSRYYLVANVIYTLGATNHMGSLRYAIMLRRASETLMLFSVVLEHIKYQLH
ncbi:hypothetical protein M422DRAFT_275126 [Sphaerobolus stellatus SS14]|uniref:DUF6533 domain-containing protein n=1 Tax=Sphaerobolus stellatus (strain SS14) TaxID=990650 RepID=A0A0C9T5J2_SPHS4|nr:hypothetical protein M422DRAFT_275126 [Sphaerobolus stellatus SS14]